MGDLVIKAIANIIQTPIVTSTTITLTCLLMTQLYAVTELAITSHLRQVARNAKRTHTH